MTFRKTHQPCESCGSSDARSINEDGSSYCFSCQERTPAITTAKEVTPTSPKQIKIQAATGTYQAIINRRLTKETAEKYGALVKGDKTVFNYYGADSMEPVAVKNRTADKKQWTEGDWPNTLLFGQNLFSEGGKYITVTEGEFDAMSVSQIFDGYPAVSVKNGAGAAAKDCRRAFEYLNSFETVVICFDSDEPGQKAAKDVAELFGNKSKIVKMTDYKDANEYLVAGAIDAFKKQWWNAESFKPDGIVSIGDLIEDIMIPIKRSKIRYPFEKLDNLLYGIREAELVTLCSGSGLGKSTILREIAFSMLEQSTDPIGLMFLEETPERTARGLIGLDINKPIHLPDVEYLPEEITESVARLNLNSRVYLWDAFGSNEIERVLGRMRYLVKGLGCKFIILDHLSILVSDQTNGDERKSIDMIMTKLRMFAQELRITLLLVSHLKRPDGKSLEDGAMTSLGQLRGSAAIGQLSDAVIGAERNSQAADPIERNTTKLRVLKNRFSGQTGPAGELYYNADTGRLTEVDMEDAL